MSMLAILALAASSTATFPHCSWDRPGVNPFMGDVVAAVDRYQDIPAATRAKLKTRMQARQYDEFALITRDKIEGQASYAPEIRDMHFGQGQVCRTVTRAKWTDAHRERGLVYCEDGHCLIVPTVCRNLSRITRLGKPLAGAAQEPAPLAKAADEPLLFEAPAAGGTPVPTFVQALQSPIPTPVPPPVSPTVTPSFLSPPGGVPPLAPTLTPQLLPPAPPLPAIPEPATWALMALGLATVLARKRRVRED